MRFQLIFLLFFFATIKPAISNERYLEITTQEGCEIVITYFLQNFKNQTMDGLEQKGQNFKIREIFLNANGLNQSQNAEIHLKNRTIKLACKGQLCHAKPDNFENEGHIYSENILTYIGGKKIRETTPKIALRLNSKLWLRAVGNNKAFSLKLIKE